MASQPLSTGAPRTARPFDAALSLTFDDVILQLEAGAAGIRRRWLLCCKRWYERGVSAHYPAKGGAL